MSLSFEAEVARTRAAAPPKGKAPRREFNDGPPPELLRRLAAGDTSLKAGDMAGAPPELHAALGDMSIAEAMAPKKAPAGEGAGDAGGKKGDAGPAVKASDLNLPDGESTVADSADATTPDSRKRKEGDAPPGGGPDASQDANDKKQAKDGQDKAAGKQNNPQDADKDKKAGGDEAGGGLTDPEGRAKVPDPKHPGMGGQGGGSVAQEFLNAAGPHVSDAADAAKDLVGAAWGMATNAFGPLVAYDKERGGFDVGNLWGVGKSIDAVFAAAGKDRGDGTLASIVKGLDVLREAASAVGTVAGHIGTTCGILSLIGLVPPLAPVGAALFSISQICATIATWSGIVSAAASLITSVLSAVQLVQAVKEGAPNVAQLYANYQTDAGNLISAGVSLGLKALFKKVGKKIGKQPVTSKGDAAKALRSGLSSTQKGALGKMPGLDGRTVRGSLYQNIKSIGGQVSLSAKGSTQKALFAQLTRTAIKNSSVGIRGQIEKSVEKKIAKVLKDEINAGAQTSGESGPKGMGATGRATMELFTTGDPGPLASTAYKGILETFASDTAPAKPNMPQTDHSQKEAADIEARRDEIAGARKHVADVKGEGKAAIAAGGELAQAAKERDKDATKIDRQVAKDQPGIAKFKKDAVSGEQQSEKGQQQADRTGGETDRLKGDAEAKKGQAASTQMPEKPKPKGLFGRIKAFFQEKIFGLARKALDGVRQMITDILLDVVAACMGVDDIHLRLAEVGKQMRNSQEKSDAAKAAADDTSQKSAEAHRQAAEAGADAQQAISEGTQTVDEATNMDQELANRDAALQAKAEGIRRSNDAFATEEGGNLDRRAAAGLVVNPERIDAHRQGVAAVQGALDGIEANAGQALARALATLTGNAAALRVPAAALDESAGAAIRGEHEALIGRMDGRRAQLGTLEAQVAGVAGQPFPEAEPVLHRVSQELARIAGEADQDLAAFLKTLEQAVQGASEAMRQAVAQEEARQRLQRATPGAADATTPAA